MKISHLRGLGLGACTALGFVAGISLAEAGPRNDPAKPILEAAVALPADAATKTAARAKPSDPIVVYLAPKPGKGLDNTETAAMAPDELSVEHVNDAKAANNRKARAASNQTAEQGAGIGKHKAIRASRFSALISKYARQHGVPVMLAQAVVRIESNFNPQARGSAGEIGLMQIKPATARGMGFSGSAKALYDPATNLRWGMKYLGGAHKLAGGDTCGTILRYNGGHYAKRMNPISARYCRKVQALLNIGKEKAYASL